VSDGMTDLFGNILKMTADEIVAGRVIQNGETPGITEDDQM